MKTRKARPSPIESATTFPEGAIRVGGNKGRWVVTKTRIGVKRWTLYENAVLKGYAPLTVDVLCKNIGKPVKVYERPIRFYEDNWPTSPRDFDVRYEITPTGDLTFGGKLRPNWLETQKPRLPSPGSKLKMAVTTKPSKLDPDSKDAKRRKSFCSRMSGMKRANTSAETANDPNSRINKALRKWNC